MTRKHVSSIEMALMNEVLDVEEFADYTIVHLRRKSGAMAPEGVQKMEARARAMVAAGLVDIGRGGWKQIQRTIDNLDVGEIRGPTEIQREQGRELWVRVNTN